MRSRFFPSVSSWLFRRLRLIAGTGLVLACIAQAGAAPVQQDRKQRIEAWQAASMEGDLAAMTSLGLEYVDGSPELERSIPKAVALFELAVAKRYGPAEYAFGWLLLSGRNRYRQGPVAGEAELRLNPQRGIELLKRSATRACRYADPAADARSPVVELPLVAAEIAALYRGAQGVPADRQQAAIWQARAALHCGDAEAATAAMKNKALRRAVAASEEQYPAPPRSQQR